MSETAGLPIVVGIDGSVASDTALRWAADEAARLRRPLLIAHARYLASQSALSATTVSTVLGELAEYAHSLIDKATDIVTSLQPTVAVTSTLSDEPPAVLLVRLAKHASMIVVGTRGDSRLAGLLLGSVSQKVAAHANCPVVILGQPRASTGVPAVAVGISFSPGGHEALRFAFEEAQARRAQLVAVRSWGDTEWYATGFGYSAPVFEDWRQADQELAQRKVDDLGSKFPEVEVRLELSSKGCEGALLEAAQTAELLVLGCRYSNEHRLSRLGPTTSWLLHRVSCPVAVVGHTVANTPHSVNKAHLLDDQLAVH